MIRTVARFAAMKALEWVKEGIKTGLVLAAGMAVIFGLFVAASIVSGLVLWTITLGHVADLQPSPFGWIDLAGSGFLLMVVCVLVGAGAKETTLWAQGLVREYKGFAAAEAAGNAR